MSEAPDKPAILAAPESASGFRHWMARNAWRLVLLFGGVLLPLAGFVALADEVHEFDELAGQELQHSKTVFAATHTADKKFLKKHDAARCRDRDCRPDDQC